MPKQIIKQSVVSSPFQDYLEIESLVKAGEKFTIKHCDGYVANETISEVKRSFGGYGFLYICESACVYSDSNLLQAEFIN